MKNNILHYPRRKNGDKSQEKNIMYFITHECGKRILHERDAFKYPFHLDATDSCVPPSFPGGEVTEVVDLACQLGPASSNDNMQKGPASSNYNMQKGPVGSNQLVLVWRLGDYARLSLCMRLHLLSARLFGGKGCSHSLALARQAALLARP